MSLAATAQKTQIVLVEDDASYAELVSEGLRDAWRGALDVSSFVRLRDAREHLARHGADCVLLDLSLPDGHGLDVLGDVVAASPSTPVVVLTGRDEEDDVGIAAVRLGAQDYLVKGRVTDDLVARAVRYAIERKRGELERRALEARYAQQALVAEALQRGLVPDVPRVPGFSVAGVYLPSGPAGRVGGDWYDVLTTADQRVVAVVGDVAGHGVQAASLMGQLATAVRAYALEDPEPESVIPALNRHLCHYAESEMATLVYVLLDPERGTARMASAGHSPAAVHRAAGECDLLEGGRGTVLGVRPGSVAVDEIELAAGDTLILYTDGLVERRGEGIDDGFERLRDACCRAPSTEPRALADWLVGELAPGPQRADDVAVLAVQALGARGALGAAS